MASYVLTIPPPPHIPIPHTNIHTACNQILQLLSNMSCPIRTSHQKLETSLRRHAAVPARYVVVRIPIVLAYLLVLLVMLPVLLVLLLLVLLLPLLLWRRRWRRRPGELAQLAHERYHALREALVVVLVPSDAVDDAVDCDVAGEKA